MTLTKVVALTALVAMSAAVVFAQAVRRDGKWEVSMLMEMPGMPAMPPFKSEQCVTKEQARDPQSAVPPQGGPNSDCTSEDTKTTGNKVSWSMKCTTPQPMTGTGEITYTENAFDGVMVMNMARGGQPMTMTMKMTGKRIGDCVK
jgi:hypothetical protein